MHIVKNFLSNFKRNKACSFLSWQAHFVFFIEVSKNNDHVLVTAQNHVEFNMMLIPCQGMELTLAQIFYPQYSAKS